MRNPLDLLNNKLKNYLVSFYVFINVQSSLNYKGEVISPTGHLALGFAAKKYTKDIPLPILLIAAYTIDLLYFIFIGLKMETYAFNPWSHSLGMALIWSMLDRKSVV